ncbi:MAG: AgmX/PglI C-terminal domain-containing protein [Pseudomonadota bacterium]
MPRALPSILAASVLLCGCPPKAPPESAVPAGPPPAVGVVQVQIDPVQRAAAAAAPKGPTPVEQAALRVLDEARPRVTTCYQAALARDVNTYGEVLVRIVVDGEGRVTEAAASLDTVGDRELVTCVEDLVRSIAFPAPGAAGLTLRYPFLFSSDLTPPEVVRAMMEQHGLLPREPNDPDVDDPERTPPTGTVETW